MKIDNFYDISQIKSKVKGTDMEKNFPSVPRPARRIVKDQETCSAEYNDGSTHSVSISTKNKPAFK
jgi:hypothetical protein